jgi:hypothetical protein
MMHHMHKKGPSHAKCIQPWISNIRTCIHFGNEQTRTGALDPGSCLTAETGCTVPRSILFWGLARVSSRGSKRQPMTRGTGVQTACRGLDLITLLGRPKADQIILPRNALAPDLGGPQPAWGSTKFKLFNADTVVKVSFFHVAGRSARNNTKLEVM